MQTAARRFSLVVFGLLSVFLILFGMLYASSGGYLPFHAAALPETARVASLPLYLALMKLIGSASASLGALCLFVSWELRRPDRRFMGEILAVAIAFPVMMAAYVAETLAAATGAPTSWHIMGGLLAADAAAYLTWRISMLSV
ncbi:MAG: hypothetical protein SGJ21_00430 [Alphaproteobacteria bacterium]|nr:hypothetical protein [Alphaproteobacteria bacterium]